MSKILHQRNIKICVSYTARSVQDSPCRAVAKGWRIRNPQRKLQEGGHREVAEGSEGQEERKGRSCRTGSRYKF